MKNVKQEGTTKKIPNKEFLLKESKTFCMLPWIHLSIRPDGKVRSCCKTHRDYSPGSLKEKSIEEIWNSNQQIQIRKDILNGIKTPACKACYQDEGNGISSLREISNREWGKHIDLVEETQEDGSLKDLSIKYLDIRFSNICNFRCRICYHELSSKWYNDTIKLREMGFQKVSLGPSKVVKIFENEKSLWDTLGPIIEGVESIYFVGGEPLMMKEHYQVLNFLLENKMDNVELRYSTNFSDLNHKGKDILKLWNQFPNVTVYASLDDSGKRGEYLRKGQNWKRVAKNRERILRYAPHIDFSVNTKVSIHNALHFIDFHKEWVEQGLINVEQMRFTPIIAPEYYSIQILPQKFKKRIEEKYLDYISFIEKGEYHHNGGFICELNGLINYMNEKNNSFLLPEFFKITKALDEIRKEGFFEIFPEWIELKNEKTFR